MELDVLEIHITHSSYLWKSMLSAIPSWDFGSKWSRTIRGTQKWGYKWHLSVSFRENAIFVFWLCQNSWFWVWNFFFSNAIFHKNHFPYYVSRPFLHQKALKQSIWSIWLFVATMLWLQKANCQKHSVWVLSGAKMVLTHRN